MEKKISSRFLSSRRKTRGILGTYNLLKRTSLRKTAPLVIALVKVVTSKKLFQNLNLWTFVLVGVVTSDDSYISNRI